MTENARTSHVMSHVTYEWVVTHIWISHITYGWVISYMDESCHIRMSLVTYEWVLSHMKEKYYIRMSRVTKSQVTNSSCCIYMRHVTYEFLVSCHTRMSPVTYEWVISHMNASCHICMGRIIDSSCRTWMRYVTYEYVVSHIHKSCHIWMRHVTYEWVIHAMNESYHMWIGHDFSVTPSYNSLCAAEALKLCTFCVSLVPRPEILSGSRENVFQIIMVNWCEQHKTLVPRWNKSSSTVVIPWSIWSHSR